MPVGTRGRAEPRPDGFHPDAPDPRGSKSFVSRLQVATCTLTLWQKSSTGGRVAVEPPSDRVDAGQKAPLRGLCGGAVLLPGDDAYNAARAAWNLAVDQRPAAIAYPGAPVEVAAARRAGVQAGARWLEAVEAAAPYGLAALHSTAPTVGVVGYSLGGGIGWQHTREVLDRWVPGGVSTGYHPDAWSRLRAVRAAVDPDQVVLANHPVPPAQPRPPSPPRGASLIPRDWCGDDATSLRALYGGTLLLPGDSGYDSEHAHPAARRSKSIPCGHCKTELRNVPTRRGRAATAWRRAVTTARRPRAADGWSVPALRGRHTT
jgi:hypothetical protein